MDGRGRLGARNWDFCDHSKQAGKMLKSISGVSVPNSFTSGNQETSLRMSSCPMRDSIIGEHSSHSPTMDFWFPQRNFIPLSKCTDHDHPTASPVSSELIDMQSMPINGDQTMHTDEKLANPAIPKVKKQRASTKKSGHVAAKVLRPKEPKKQQLPNPTRKKGGSVSIGKREKKNQDGIAEGIQLDLSSVPVPVCSCTGVPRQCYRWGAGGWQSSCCTTSISEYPLPMSPSRPGARLAGRKMSIGAYGKLLQRLAAEGHDLSYAVDLKDHWARHGTNKFVTIR